MVHSGIRARLAPVLAALLAAGCASFDGLAPKAVRADAAALAASRSLAGARLSPAAWPSSAWWQRFGDPQLDALIAEGLAGNPGMRSARARIDKAIALAASSGAARLRYRAGIGSYLQVLAAEAPLLEQKSLQASLRARELELSINLIRALGGGFEDASAAGAS